MDPLSVLSLLATLGSLIKTSNQLLQIAKSFREADRDLLELCNDVTFFEESLKGFGRVLRSRRTKHGIDILVIKRAFEESFNTIQELETRLSQIAKSDTSAVRRIKWLQSRSAIRKLHERVKSQSSMLQNFLVLAHTETSLDACGNHSHVPQITLSAEDDVPNHMTTLADSGLSDTASLRSWSSLASSSGISVETAVSSVGSSRSSVQAATSNESDISMRSQELDCYKKPEVVRKACRFNCYCSCHSTTEVDKGGLTRAFSRLGISNLPCDDPNCQSVSFVVEAADSASHFLQKVLARVLAAHSVKQRYYFNTFHMIPVNSDVIRYIKQGDLDNLIKAIQSGNATIWDTAPDGWSLLHVAAYNRQLPIVNYLLGLGAPTEVADVGARKPADLAFLNSLVSGAGQIEHEIEEAFAEKDDYLSDFAFTPIHVAALDLYDPSDRERPSLQQLLDLVDDCNNAPAGTNWAKRKANYKKRSPLFRDVIEYFRASADEKPKDTKIIHNLIDQTDKSLCWTPLHWAYSKGKKDRISTLLHYGADPYVLSNLNSNILHAAAESKVLGGLDDALDIWRRCPDKLNIDQLNYWGETPLHIAAWGSAENVEKLVAAGANRNIQQEDGQVPLHYAGMTARGEARRQIIDHLCEADDSSHINAQDSTGRPPLFDYLDDARCVEMLINYGASLDLLDETGKSAFHHACMLDNEATLKMLLRQSPSGSVLVTVKDHDGNTALNVAISYRSKCCALALLELDDVGDMVGNGGWTATHYAAKFGDPEVLEAVLHHRSFIKGMKTINGKTAEVVAMEENNWCGKVKDLLRQHNAIT